MAAVPDTVAAVMAFLKADAIVAGLTEGRVWGSSLPSATGMPRYTVLISPSGGTDAGGYVQLGAQRLDVKCYGETLGAARVLSNGVYGALKQMPPGDWAGARLYSATPESRAIEMRDPDARWPLVLSVWQVLVAEVAAA